MAPEPVKCTLKTFGTFSTPTFGGVGEPFNDGRQSKHSMQCGEGATFDRMAALLPGYPRTRVCAQTRVCRPCAVRRRMCAAAPLLTAVCLVYVCLLAEEDRTTGRQFTTNKQRSGQVGDNWNRGPHGKRIPIQRLYEGEKFVDPHKTDQLLNKAAREKNLTTNGFKFSSPNKRSSGLGGYWGCIGPKHAHEPDYEVVKHGEKPGPVIHEMKQVQTGPGKKGYGSTTPGCIFGPGPLRGEIGMGRYGGREYAHSTDPYDAARKKEQEDRVKDIEALQGRPPFKSMSKAVDFFDGHGRVASSKAYTEDPRVPERPAKPPEFTNVSDRPFFPAQAPKSGPQGTFNKFPEYKEDPLHLKVEAAKKAAEEARAVGDRPFKPTGKPHSTPTPSILFHTPGPSITS